VILRARQYCIAAEVYQFGRLLPCRALRAPFPLGRLPHECDWPRRDAELRANYRLAIRLQAALARVAVRALAVISDAQLRRIVRPGTDAVPRSSCHPRRRRPLARRE